MASSSLWKVQMMRRKDFSGEKECREAWLWMAARMEARFAGVNITGSSRLVIMRVLEGGEGCWSGGRLSRSRERLEAEGRRLEREPLEERERGGVEASEAAMGASTEGMCRTMRWILPVLLLLLLLLLMMLRNNGRVLVWKKLRGMRTRYTTYIDELEELEECE